MTLGFQQKINGQTNYFVGKIWEGLLASEVAFEYPDYIDAYIQQFGKHWDASNTEVKPKITTIREDKHNRWRAGMDIHFVINNRSANRFQFAPALKCVSVQEIEIKHTKSSKNTPLIYIEVDRKCLDTYNGEISSFGLIDKLAINDGFESVADFFAYFNKDFKGKIIHWTNLKY